MSQQPPKPPTAPAVSPRHDPRERTSAKEILDEDALHVPRGVSRKQFLFLVGLMIFLMVIWLVPGATMNIFGGSGNRNPVRVRFQLPDREKPVEWTFLDVQSKERSLQGALTTDPYMAYSVGLEPRRPELDALVRVLVVDALARGAGIEITDEELRSHLTELLGFQRATKEDYLAALHAQGLDPRTVEEGIRTLMRVARFQQLVGFAGAVPDPAKIEEQWHKDNVEFAFDYVDLPVSELMTEARNALPADAELETWFQKLPEGEKQAFRTDEKRSAVLAIFRDSETTPIQELVAAFPEVQPEGVEATAPDELAHQYYDQVYAVRFPRAAGEDPDAVPGFFGFEEVADACRSEAPAYFAMQRWLADLTRRKAAGETLDLAAEAQKYGLETLSFPEPMTRTEYAGAEGFASAELGAAVFGSGADGSLYYQPIAVPIGIALVQVTGRTEPELPAFATIRERVAEKWLEPKAQELALERLREMRKTFETFTPAAATEEETPAGKKEKGHHHRTAAETFRSAANAIGLEVKTRDYLNRADRPGANSKDPLWERPDHRALVSLANSLGLYTLETDEVAEPGLSSDRNDAFLVRLAGKREVPLENMSPADYQRYKAGMRSQGVGEIAQNLNLDFLRKNYKLWILDDSEEAKADKGAGTKGAGG